MVGKGALSTHRHLRAWRRKVGLTLEQVAERLGVGHSAVHKWESGEVPVTLPRLESLAQLYGAKHPFELLFPPGEGNQAGALAEAFAILQVMSPGDRDAWLQVGRRMSGGAPGESAAPFHAAA